MQAPELNLIFAWCWLSVGLLAGMVAGLFFHRDDWMGGYDSWRRRMTRLGHVAFIGTALLNFMFVFTVRDSQLPDAALRWASFLLLIGAIAMPTVCYASAWRKPLRHLFAVPVVCLVGGVTVVAVTLVLRWVNGG
ncbi:MAG: hypothetical protein IT445_13810 [Phycisphaeraceae bacterium]|nr:hypothetical protein [Phycisphaeraceae bacterium]